MVAHSRYSGSRWVTRSCGNNGRTGLCGGGIDDGSIVRERHYRRFTGAVTLARVDDFNRENRTCIGVNNNFRSSGIVAYGSVNWGCDRYGGLVHRVADACVDDRHACDSTAVADQGRMGRQRDALALRFDNGVKRYLISRAGEIDVASLRHNRVVENQFVEALNADVAFGRQRCS